MLFIKSLVILAIWLAVSSAIYSQIAPFSPLNRIFFLSNENGTVKQKKKKSDFKVFFLTNQSHCRKMKDKNKPLFGKIGNICCQNKMDEFNYFSQYFNNIYIYFNNIYGIKKLINYFICFFLPYILRSTSMCWALFYEHQVSHFIF